MQFIFRFTLSLLLAVLAATQVFADAWKASRIVVANRNGGTISVIDTKTNMVTQTVFLPMDAKIAEPMYVVDVPIAHRVFVGDRANNRVVVLNDKDLSVVDSVRVGAGVFHMWANTLGTQLWVTSDVDKTLSVIDPKSLKVTTFPIPADIAANGGKPHDVILADWPMPSAYVTFVGLSGAHDYVVKYSTSNFTETGRADVGKDPHVSLNIINDKLYVAAQGSNTLYTIDRGSMKILSTTAIPGAHGVSLLPVGKSLYVTDITAVNGKHALYQFDIMSNKLVGAPIDTGASTSHNIAQDALGNELYITHSGAMSSKVSHYHLDKKEGKPTFVGDIYVGLNPFGLALVY